MGVTDAMPSDAEILRLYGKVLDHLLVPPHIKDNLCKTQSKEKKWQLVMLHKHVLVEDNQVNEFTEAHRRLLASISKNGRPDIASLIELKSVLSAATKHFLMSFFEYGGAQIFVKCIDDRIKRVPMTTLDFALLHEVILCIKIAMNNLTGMESIVSYPYAIERVVEALCFDSKPLVLQVLEILSVCCCHSDTAAQQVIDGMRRLAKKRCEGTFDCLSRALLEEDIEVRVAVLQFVNNMLMGLEEARYRLLVRSELASRMFSENYRHALAEIEEDMEFLRSMDSGNKRDVERMERLVTLNGRGVGLGLGSGLGQLGNNKAAEGLGNNRAAEGGSEAGASAVGKKEKGKKSIVVGSGIILGAGKNAVEVNPAEGVMTGQCLAAKNSDIKGTIGQLFGAKKTKHRLYELDGESFTWYKGSVSENEFKGSFPVTSIVDIRFFTSDPGLIGECDHTFEIETPERTYALGCDSAEEKDLWLVALQVARDNAVLTKSTYKLRRMDIYPADMPAHFKMFKQQGKKFAALEAEDRQQTVLSTGVDLNKYSETSAFLHSELLAQGLDYKFTELLQELMLLPPNSRGHWSSLVEHVRSLHGEDSSGGATPGALIARKAAAQAEESSSYEQVSKLALAVMAKDNEIAMLNRKLQELQRASLGTAGAGDLEKAPNRKSRARGVHPRGTSAGTDMGPMANAGLSAGTGLGSGLGGAGLGSGSGTPLPPQPEDEKMAKYSRMLKMGLPEGAVRGKMSMDDVSAADVDAFFSRVSGVPAAPVEDEKFAKYRKMLQMGLPEGAVRAKMAMDDLSQADIDKFFALPPPASKMADVAGVAAKLKLAVKPRSSITATEEGPPQGMLPKSKIEPRKKLKGIFWTKLKNAEITDTLWLSSAPYFQLNSSEQELVESWFSAVQGGKDLKEAKAARPRNISLFDGKRTQNVLIALGKLRKQPHEIVEMVVLLDTSVLRADLTLTIISICPTADEVEAATSCETPELLDQVGQLFLLLSEVPRLLQRLECHRDAFHWSEEAAALIARQQVVLSACAELDASEPLFVRVLNIILETGNYLNGGTARGQAYGVRLDVLSKMQGHKTSDGRGTLLGLVVRELEGRAYADLLEMTKHWMYIFAAADISSSQLDTDLRTLATQVEKARKERDVGVQVIIDAGCEEMADLLAARLDEFLADSEQTLQQMQQMQQMVSERLLEVMTRYGEKSKVKDEDSGKDFFKLISNFGKNFRQQIADNAKAKKAVAGTTASPPKLAKVPLQTTAVEAGPRPETNLFANFHDKENESAATEGAVGDKAFDKDVSSESMLPPKHRPLPKHRPPPPV